MKRAVTVALTFALAAGPAAADEPRPVKHLIDTHIHIYTLDNGVTETWPPKDDTILRTPHLPAEYSKIAKASGVTGVVIVESSNTYDDNQWVLDLVADDPFYVGLVGNVDLTRPDFETLIVKLKKDRRFVGVRARGARPVDFTDPTVLANLKTLAKHDLAMDYLANGGGTAGVETLDELARAIPELRLVANHCLGYNFDGQPPPADWVAAVEKLAANKNVACKISGLYQRSVPQPAPQDVEHYRAALDVLWKAFGKDRLIYGSNWPVTKHTGSYQSFHDLVDKYVSEKGQDAREHYYWKNAATAYKLSLK